jgi:hypothetical protein
VIQSELRDFPLALVGEAIGQLAAWAAMAAVEFGQRPVAGLAGSIELLHAPRPGRVLELAAEIEQVDTESEEYRGTAHVDGTPVMRLHDCVGPMVPLAEFDDPQKLEAKLKQRSPDQASLALETRAADELIATAGLDVTVGGIL